MHDVLKPWRTTGSPLKYKVFAYVDQLPDADILCTALSNTNSVICLKIYQLIMRYNY